MKRIVAIFLSSVLALMTILSGGGITLVHCNHSGVTRICISDSGIDTAKDCNGNCIAESSCMELSTQYLQPTVYSPGVALSSPDFQTVDGIVIPPVSYNFLHDRETSGAGHRFFDKLPLPPRLNLSLNCILLV